ncbi:hypothetical protein SAMN04515675_6084 [Pseudomonas costantinii]|uniref:Uncharacterized protein n=1 Tax=Pseudomonas costantinii TaxID=168469 RepID=A0A1H5JLK2_9PSED|nr:hypothetical protein SAMN04515675_6084 [Pseudomonas costantinii]
MGTSDLYSLKLIAIQSPHEPKVIEAFLCVRLCLKGFRLRGTRTAISNAVAVDSLTIKPIAFGTSKHNYPGHISSLIGPNVRIHQYPL